MEGGNIVNGDEVWVIKKNKNKNKKEKSDEGEKSERRFVRRVEG